MKIFPNYLKTFNYKLSVDLLPFKTKFIEFGLDTNSRCVFYSLHTDTSYHVFSQCLVLKFIWDTLDCVMQAIGFRFRFTKTKECGILDLLNVHIAKNEENIVMYLNSVCNQKIWGSCQKVIHDEIVFENKVLMSAIYKAVCGRSMMERGDRVVQCKKVENLDRLLEAIKSTFFPPRGIG